MEQRLYILLTGIGATLCMDAWTMMQRRVFGLPSLDYALLGRWIIGMQEGVFWPAKSGYATITASPKREGEVVLGWLTHYLTGIGLAFLPAIIADREWFTDPSLLLALLVGLFSLTAPFLIMQPAFGFGIAASKTPTPHTSRALSLLAHLAFGAGLFVSAKMLLLVPLP